MPKITKSQLKSVLATADEVRAWQSHVPPVRTRIAGMQGSRHAVEKVFTASMRNAKVDVEKLATIRSNHAAELNRLLKAEAAEALKVSAKAKTMLAANIASRREALQQLHNVPLTPALPTFITLTEPFLIWATPRSNLLSDSQVQPWGSYAKIKVAPTSGGYEKLSFYFLWNNPSDYHAVINASSYLALNGYFRAYAEGSLSYLWNVGGHTSSMYLSASLNCWEWWNQPPTLTRSDTKPVLELSANAGFFDDTQTKTLSDVVDFEVDQFVVPPNGVVVFEVALNMSYSVDDGHVHINFEDGGHEVVCPAISIALLTPPVATNVVNATHASLAPV